MNTGKSKSEWSNAEIQAAVDAYLSMLLREQNGQKVNKAHENRVLREGALAGRTKGSVEFRMQNISTVLVAMGQERIKGYKPAKNVGANVERCIRKAVEAQSTLTPEDFAPTADDETLERRAIKLEQLVFEGVPEGILKPQLAPNSSTLYVRDPMVRAWVRQTASGICESCDQPGPFVRVDGSRFLEVHHVKHLAKKGSDRPSNAVALCPNCHRRCHHSSDKDQFTLSLYGKVARLIPE
jgi:5-methylcytosine-specific restriction protein A